MDKTANKTIPWWQTAAVPLIILSIAGPLLLGGATANTQLAISIVSCVACAWVVATWPRTLNDGVVPWAAVGASGAAVWTLIQAVPVPCNWVRVTQPYRFDVMRELVELGAMDRPICTISLAPGATWAALSIAATLPAVLLATMALCRQGQTDVLIRSMALSSIVMAVVTLAHWTADATSIFGMYVPAGGKLPSLVAPLINPNHLAGHMAMGWPLCLALSTRRGPIEIKLLWYTGSLLVLATGLLSLSRGGAGAIVGGGIAYSVGLAIRRRQRRGRRVAADVIAGTGIVILSLALGAYFVLASLRNEFEGHRNPLEKFSIMAALAQLVPEHPWTGIGRGALADVSTQVVALDARVLLVENALLQWVIEWGVPCALGLLATFVLSAVRVRVRSRMEIALACGLGAIALQNLVDFSLELIGIATTAAVGLGCLLSREHEKSSSIRLPAMRPFTFISAGGAILGTLCALPALTVYDRDLLRARVQSAIKETPESVSGLLDTAFSHYPIDPAFILLGAAHAVREQSRLQGRWINLAMRTAPAWAGTHLLAARALERRGAVKQAAIEISIATDLEVGAGASAGREFLQRHPSAEIASSLSAKEPRSRRNSVEDLASSLRASREEAERFALLGLEEFPNSSILHQRAVETAPNAEVALRRAQDMVSAIGKVPNAVLLLGQRLLAQGKPLDALALIESCSTEVRQTQSILELEMNAAALIRDRDRVQATLHAILQLFGRTVQARAGIHMRASQTFTKLDDPLGSLAQAQRAYDISGSPEALEAVHLAAVRAGSVPVALRTSAELCQIRHNGGRYCARSSKPPAP